ncbi:MAG: hypothetical protein Q8R79_03415 [Legionellaceae bacterium]|nr:hypothetical protein [Legionellaceae bacterium]
MREKSKMLTREYLEKNIPIILLATMLFFLIFLIFRSSGIDLVVLADEYLYSKFARLLPLSASTIPEYIYFSIYHVTNYCGRDFLTCTKVLNSLFFVSAIPFIFLISRSIMGPFAACLVALLAIASPINSYTAYFMPESLYFLVFWIFSWYILSLNASSNTYRWCLAGAILGTLSFVKPHAVFLLPSIALYILYVFKNTAQSNQKALLSFAYFFISAILVKFFGGYLFAGKSGLTVLGGFYTSFITNPLSISAFMRLTLQFFTIHFTTLSFLYSLPFATALCVTLEQISSKKHYDPSPFHKVCIFSIFVLLNLLLVTSLFSAELQEYNRLHMRYYNFALPFFYIIAIKLAYDKEISPEKLSRYIIGIPIGIAIFYATYSHLTPYISHFVDNPEICGLIKSKARCYSYGILSLFALFLWLQKKSFGSTLFAYGLLPFAVLASSFNVSSQLHQSSPNPYDRAGILTKQYLPTSALKNTVVIGFEPVGLYRTLFYLDTPSASFKVAPRGSTYDLAKLPKDTRWIVLIGDLNVSDKHLASISMGGFRIMRTKNSIISNLIEFNALPEPLLDYSIKGLSVPEKWGTWSIEKTVSIQFNHPLPNKFKIQLVAHAFGPNIDKPFYVQVGNDIHPFHLTAANSTLSFKIDNLENANTININIPEPTSPQELGLSNEDDRKLGIGLVQLKIQAIQNTPSKNTIEEDSHEKI